MTICIIGMGYVGLPLAMGVSTSYRTVGYDIDTQRIKELSDGLDVNNEFERAQFSGSEIQFTSDESDIANCSVYFVTVPTPVDSNNVPDLKPLANSCKLLSKNLEEGDIVVFESTVYPGATEEICVPILETGSGLKFKEEFQVAYSPERINPGDKVNTIDKINKLLAASSEEAVNLVKTIYESFLKSEIIICETIKIAEAAKVLENTQRDVNIALINEFYSVLSALDIDTHKVIDAAATKWNFHKYTPGLVGGHCISVDPHYFAYKAGSIGIKTKILLAARETNEQLVSVIVEKLLVELLSNYKENLSNSVLIVGAAFKENCPDFRNTKSVDVFAKLKNYGLDVDIHDPLVDPDKFFKTYGINIVETLEKSYHTVLFLVPHKEFDESFWKRLINVNKLNLILDFKAKIKIKFENVDIIT